MQFIGESLAFLFLFIVIGGAVTFGQAKRALERNPRARQAAASGAFWLLGKLLGRK